ncbi:MAG: tetratricopeptide repeat protein [bacterium]
METKDLLGDAQRFFVKGEYEESARKFTEAIEAGAEPSLAYLSRGTAYFKINRMDEAIQDFSKAVELNKNKTRGYYYRGIAYMTKEDYRSALPDLNRVIELDSEHGAAFLARGTLYGLIGEEEKSAKDMKTAIMKSETEIQRFADTSGIIRTQFHSVMAHLSGEGPHVPALSLSEEEIATVKRWISAT